MTDCRPADLPTARVFADTQARLARLILTTPALERPYSIAALEVAIACKLAGYEAGGLYLQVVGSRQSASNVRGGGRGDRKRRRLAAALRGTLEAHARHPDIVVQAAAFLPKRRKSRVETDFLRGGAAAARLAHNQEVAGASPAPATSSPDCRLPTADCREVPR